MAEEKREAAMAAEKGTGAMAVEKGKGAMPTAAEKGKGPMPAAAGGKAIKLKTNDGKIFEVPAEAARLFKTIGGMIDDGCADGIIPLPNVRSKDLDKAIEYCNKHFGVEAGDDNSESDDPDWDKEFVGKLEDDDLHDLMLAAHYLDLTGLFDLTCQAVADKIKGKTPEQVRAYFNIANDFTPEEEAEIRDELAWAFGH